MIKYLGSKRILVPDILRIVASVPEVHTVVDLFSGTSRVGHALKQVGYRVRANDHNRYAAVLARCYLEADATLAEEATARIAALEALPGRDGWFTETYCRQSRYFRPENGVRIEAMREQIAQWQLPEPLASVLLVSLMEAADRVDSTVGVQMAWLKAWAPRAHKPLALRLPALLPASGHGPSSATELDAIDAAAQTPGDLIYLDPPYNQHKYLGNYHVWETLCRWDAPEVYGVACKRIDCRTRKSPFNSRPNFAAAFQAVIQRTPCRNLLVSFSNEGYLSADQLLAMLRPRGHVTVFAKDHPRYVGARIGIHNPDGVKVGTVGHLRNTERLFLVTPDPVAAPAKVAKADAIP